VKYSTEGRFPHGGFEINFDLPRRRQRALARSLARSLARDIYLDERGRMKDAGSMAVPRVGEWPLPKRIRRDEWRDEIVTEKKKKKKKERVKGKRKKERKKKKKKKTHEHVSLARL